MVNSSPISANATSSEFETKTLGTRYHWITPMRDSLTSFESIELFYVPGMNMTQAIVLACAQLG